MPHGLDWYAALFFFIFFFILIWNIVDVYGAQSRGLCKSSIWCYNYIPFTTSDGADTTLRKSWARSFPNSRSAAPKQLCQAALFCFDSQLPIPNSGAPKVTGPLRVYLFSKTQKIIRALVASKYFFEVPWVFFMFFGSLNQNFEATRP